MEAPEISVSILNADFARISEIVKEIEDGGADSLHLDVMDGHFVRNLSFGPAFIKSIRKLTDIRFDAHLMVENPDRYLQEFVDAGCDSLIVHLESGCDIDATMARIKEMGLRAGLAVNPDTEVNKAEKHLENADMLLIMTVVPGFGGQAFIDSCLQKVRQSVRLISERKLDLKIAVDGGIGIESGRKAVQAGASQLVAGSSLLKLGNIGENIRKLKSSCVGPA